MKKFAITVVCLLALSITAIPAGAQTRNRTYNRNVQTSRYSNDVYRDRNNRDRSYRNNVDANSRYGTDQYGNYPYGKPSFWEQHRDKITTAGGTAAGAIIGGLAGGKKGAIIGAIAGGGGAALYTYKIRDKYFR